MSNVVFLMEPETENHFTVGLKPVADCPQCGRMSLSQVVICKGANTPGNRGKRYQVVRTPEQNSEKEQH